jgi:Icc protein
MLIAQISDLHLRAEGVLYQGLVDSNADFARVVAHLNARAPQPDLILLSGDVVDEGQPAEYETARRLLAGLKVPVYAIPGNHDEWRAFQSAFAQQPGLPAEGPFTYAIEDAGSVRVIALDVTVPGKHHGEIMPSAMEWLARTLSQEPTRPTLIMMHQPPFECAIPYLDPYLCRNGQWLAEVVQRYANVERVLCGHVHRAMHRRFAGTIATTAPSTTTTIALQLDPAAKPASFHEPPGYLLHHWRDGALITHHVLVGDFEGPLPFA